MLTASPERFHAHPASEFLVLRISGMHVRLTSLQGRQAILLGASAVLGVLAYLGITLWPLPALLRWSTDTLGMPPLAGWVSEPLAGLLLTGIVLAPGVLWLSHWAVHPFARLLRALEGAVGSYRDGDFSFSIASDRRDELGDLVRMHNQLGHTLREQRQHLTQRELMLDTVVQHTPVALVLVDRADRVTYSNLAARRLFNEGRTLDGVNFAALCAQLPLGMRDAIGAHRDSLFTADMEGGEETFHISRRQFRLQGRLQQLFLFRRMTRELSRQEVITWKRVIRVISHELNNSLAPISSLTHSGLELVRRGDSERLNGVFNTIGERARHLHRFIEGYANFARLPAPQATAIEWRGFLDALALHCEFRLLEPLPDQPGYFDSAQIEQVLINLIKNAHESSDGDAAVTLAVTTGASDWRIEVADRGPGMSEAVLGQALLPFYSTKRSGTGLGLALAREIVEAHNGRIQLANREEGGLCVTLILPEA